MAKSLNLDINAIEVLPNSLVSHKENYIWNTTLVVNFSMHDQHMSTMIIKLHQILLYSMRLNSYVECENIVCACVYIPDTFCNKTPRVGVMEIS